MTMSREETNRFWYMRMHLREAFSRLAAHQRLANPGSGQCKAELLVADNEIPEHKLPGFSGGGEGDVERLNLHEGVNGVYRMHFRLPRFNGHVCIPVSLAPDTQKVSQEQRTALDQAMGDLLRKAAAQLRGRTILELLEQDWEIPSQEQTHSKVEIWQRLEAGGLRLVAAADALRK